MSFRRKPLNKDKYGPCGECPKGKCDYCAHCQRMAAIR